ncbi:MAG: hypothetical protein AB2535_17550 [Candidatus Thiodiazotropha endolucinida]
MKRLLYLILVIFIVTACSSELTANEELMMVAIGNKEICYEVSELLHKNNIWFQELPGYNLSIKKQKIVVNKVLRIVSEVIDIHMPPERNVSFPEKIHPYAIERFNKEGIEYKLIELLGDTYIVWDESDHKKANKIVEEILRAPGEPR